MTRHVLIRTLIAAGVFTVALGGCAPAVPAGTSASPAAVDEVDSEVDSDSDESATPTGTPDDSGLAADVLFRITATATAPGGAVAQLVETVHVPRAISTTDAADLDANLCDTWRSMPGALIQDAEIVATTTSGTWPAHKDIPFTVGVWAIFDGSFKLAQAYCSPGWLGTPGASTGRHVFPGGDPDSAGGWATEEYGFATGFDGEVGPDDVVLSACAIELGPTAAGTSSLASAWPAYTQPSPNASCTFGG